MIGRNNWRGQGRTYKGHIQTLTLCNEIAEQVLFAPLRVEDGRAIAEMDEVPD